MSNKLSPGARFRKALKENQPLQIVGTINAYAAMMAEKVGHQAIYLSGGGVANASYGLPDLGMTSMNDVVEDVRRITAATDVPLLVDIDTGWGGAFNIGRTIREMERAGAAAVHIEDQVAQKRCGHRPNKEIVSQEEMVDRIKAAVDAREDKDFFIMARTDAFQASSLKRSPSLNTTKRSPKPWMRPSWPTSPNSAPRRCITAKSWPMPALTWCFTRSAPSAP